MAALDTLYFDLKINDLTDEQMKAIKARLEKSLGTNIDIGKQIEKSAGKAESVKVKIGADTSAVEDALSKVKSLVGKTDMSPSERAELVSLSKVVKNISDDKLKIARADEVAQRAADSHAIAQEKLAAASLRTEKAQTALATANQKAAQTASSHIRANLHLGQSLTGLISITGDLRNQIGTLISVYTVEHLLRNVVEIGGEFEKQKLAMGSMLGSLEQADDIFNRMKNLALTSPFNFKDLSNYSRQLTAYGTEYKDLYDTTNRLADISAGLGGDMSRLVLAFSQVKAAAYLRGQEMRQFTEFGVGLPELLAEKYSKAEGRIVTAGDVIERVSKRMVSFNDVKDVLWKSTDKGGKFYEMQNVLSQSTAGMASNLKDAIDTAYYDISHANSGVIKGTIKDITALVKRWRELGAALVSVGGVYALRKIGMAANNRLIGQGTAETIKGVMVAKQEEASLLIRKSLYSQLTEEEKALVATRNRLTAADVKGLAASRAINSDNAMRMVAGRKVSATDMLSGAGDLNLSEGQLGFLMKTSMLESRINNAGNAFSRFGLRVRKELMLIKPMATNVLNGIGASLSSIFSPANIAMLVIGGVADAWLDYNNRIQAIDDKGKEIVDSAADSAKKASKFLEENPIEIPIKAGGEELDKTVDLYRKEIENRPVDMSLFLKNVDSIPDTADKLKALRSEMDSIRKMDENTAKYGNPMLKAQKANESIIPDWLVTASNVLRRNVAFIHTLGNAIPQVRAFNASTDGIIERLKSMDGIIKDVNKDLDDLVQELSKVPGSEIETIIGKVAGSGHEKAAKILQDMVDRGESNVDILKTVINLEGQLGEKFVNVNSTIKAAYLADTDAMTDKMRRIAKDTAAQLDATTPKDISRKSEQYADMLRTNVEAAVKAGEYTSEQGDEMLFHAEESLQGFENLAEQHPKAFANIVKKVKEDLASHGKALSTATQAEIVDSFNRMMREYSVMEKYATGWLSNIISYYKHNPIEITAIIKRADSDKGFSLFGFGKYIANSYKSFASQFSQDELGGMTDEEKMVEAAKAKDETLKKNIETAKSTTLGNVKQMVDARKEFRAKTRELINWDTVDNGGKDPQKKVDKKDHLLDDVKNRLDRLKKMDSLFKELIGDSYGVKSALNEVRKSGMSYSSVLSADIHTREQYDQSYINQLSKLIRKLSAGRKRLTKERLKELDELREERERRKGEMKKAQFDDVTDEIKAEMDENANKWEQYKKLVESGMLRSNASMLAFGMDKSGKTPVEDRAEMLATMMRGNGYSGDIDFSLNAKEVEKLLGGKNSPMYERYYNTWIQLKKDIESEKIELQVDGQNAIEQFESVAEKIASLKDKYMGKSIIGEDGKKAGLGNLVSFDGDTMVANNGVTDKAALAFVSQYNEKVDELRSTLFELLPIYEKIFGDNKFKSGSQIFKAMDAAKEIVGKASIKKNKDGKPITFISEFTDTDGVHKISGTYSTLKQLIKAVDELYSAGMKKSPIKAISEAIDDINSKDTDTAKKGWEELGQAVNIFADSIGNAAGEIGGMLDKLGDVDAADAMAEISGIAKGVGTLGNAAGQIASGDILGGVATGISGITGIIGSIAEAHDKRLDRAIEKSRLKVQELSDAYDYIEKALKYNLGNAAVNTIIDDGTIQKIEQANSTISSIRSKGYLTMFDIKSLEEANKTLKDNWATVKYLDKNSPDYGNAYNYQRNLQKEQLEELKRQRQDEEAKKKSDKGKIEDYNKQIKDAELRIQQFSMELANSLYGIDLKGWASQLGDALFEAWQKGESGADAFKNKVDSIMASVVNSWMKTNILERGMEKAFSYLFGTKEGNYQDGAFSKDNNLDESEMSTLGGLVMGIKDSVDTYFEVLDVLNPQFKKYGLDIKNPMGESSTSNAIKGVSEQEANIIAAYMDAIRQDTYSNRMNVQKIVDDGISVSSPVIESQLQQMKMIESNTRRNVELLEGVKGMINDVILGNQKIHII